MFSLASAVFDKLIRQGMTFRKYLRELDVSEFKTPEEIRELQDIKLRRLIRHCYENVPFYRELFDSLKLTPDDIRTGEDLKKLPFIDKKTIRNNFDKFIARNMNKALAVKAETSGSTGEPALFLRDYRSVNFENAVLWRFRRAAGGNNTRKLVLRGDIVAPVDRKTPPFWKHDPVRRELVMSSYHLNDENLGSYIEEIKRFRPEVIYGYPSSIYLLARLMAKRGASIRLKAIFTSSESISANQRELIEEVFGGTVYDWYGQVERVASIGQCEKGTYHIIEDYSITELVETDAGLEVVGTNLNNYIMPLIRFRTADIVTLSEKRCSCGRHFREVEKIKGRGLNYIYSPEGNRLSLFLASDSIDYDNNVSEVQFVQLKKGELIVNIVKNDRFTEKDGQKIIRSIKEHTSPDMAVILNEVDKIPRGSNGKVVNSIIEITGEDWI